MAGNYRKDRAPQYIDRPPEDLPGPPLRSCQSLVREAQRQHFWLYDPDLKAWYSPEEFEDKFGRVVSGNEKWLARIQVRDPMEGIDAGYQRLQDLEIKLKDFTQKVIQYYRQRRS
jgi:hypothetical protein